MKQTIFSGKGWNFVGGFLICAILLLLGILIFLLCLNREIHVDAHQFIAPPIFHNAGLLPYLDYPYFHLPYQIWIYAGLLKLTSNLFLGARILNALAGFATILLVYRYCHQLLEESKIAYRRLVGVSIAVLLACSTTFPIGVSRVWNHPLSTLMAVASFILLIRGTRRQDLWSVLLSGLCLGLAIGIRLTWMPLGLPFGLGLIFLNVELRDWRTIARRIGVFGVGVAVSLLPLGILAALSWDQFWYGNFLYPGYSALAHLNDGGTVSLGAKLKQIVKFYIYDPTNSIASLLLLGLISCCFTFFFSERNKGWGIIPFSLLALLFAMGGAYASSQVYGQYHYGPYAFLVLAIAGCAGHVIRNMAEPKAVMAFLVSGALLTALVGWRFNYPRFSAESFVPRNWPALQAAAMNREILDLAKGGKILTLAPIYSVLAGAEHAYEEFATGRFVWRVADLHSPIERSKYGLVGPESLPAFLAKDPPSGILVGFDDLEPPLIDYARTNQFTPIPLKSDPSGRAVLWINPSLLPQNTDENSTASSAESNKD